MRFLMTCIAGSISLAMIIVVTNPGKSDLSTDQIHERMAVMLVIGLICALLAIAWRPKE